MFYVILVRRAVAARAKAAILRTAAAAGGSSAFQWLALAYGAPKYSGVPADNILRRLAYIVNDAEEMVDAAGEDIDDWIK